MEIEKDEIMSLLDGQMNRGDFRAYIYSCIKKWDRIKQEMEIIDIIINTICKHWGITKDDLLGGRNPNPRFLMYYIIKTDLSLSYKDIGEMFGHPKSYVHKGVDDISNIMQNHSVIGGRHIVRVFDLVMGELRPKNQDRVFATS